MHRALPLVPLVLGALMLPSAAAEDLTPREPVAVEAAALSADLHVLPLSSGEVDPSTAWPATEPRGTGLVLVQLREFGLTGAVQAIAGTGARLVQPLAPVSYVVLADAGQTRAVRALPDVRWAGVLPAAAKTAASVTQRTERLRVTVAGSVPEALARAEGDVRSRAFTDVDGAVVDVPGDATTAIALAALPSVYSVADADAGAGGGLRDEKTAQVVARGSKPVPGPGYRDFLDEHGVDGSGVVVSHVDSGADGTHPELSDRIAGCRDYTQVSPHVCRTPFTDGGGHGTHTLGIVLGTGSTERTDTAGHRLGLGVAPGARAFVQNALHRASTLDYGDPAVFRSLYEDAVEAGATVSANSWGPSGEPQGYDAVTREADQLVRDADDDAAGDQPITLVFSIMNGRGRVSTQGSPDEAKNIIAVGASGSGRSGPGLDDLCTCTAHGPALDGRRLPTLVAPGQAVASARMTVGTSCGTPFTEGTAISAQHSLCTGTSMASPHVSGGTAVFTQFHRERYGRTPSPALIKAAFVNGAVDLAGGKDANGTTLGSIPDDKQGWGRFSLGNVLSRWRAGVVRVDQEVVLDRAGQSWTTTVEPAAPGTPLKVSLAWTDAPGPGLGGAVPAWVNDLDLTVTAADGTTWRGNVFSDGVSVPGGSPERRDNLENVFLPTPGPGPYVVTVSAANLLGDGLPSRPGATDQDFALVVTGARGAAG